MKKVAFFLSGVMIGLAALGSATSAGAWGGTPNTIVDKAIATTRLNTFISALTAAGMIKALRGDGPYTVFAPSDDAFKSLTTGRLQYLLNPDHKQELQALLKNHLVKAKLNPNELANLRSVQTLDQKTIPIQLQGASVTIDGAGVLQAGITASNGVIYIIDKVLTP